jgi:hypothetical protein
VFVSGATQVKLRKVLPRSTQVKAVTPATWVFTVSVPGVLEPPGPTAVKLKVYEVYGAKLPTM